MYLDTLKLLTDIIDENFDIYSEKEERHLTILNSLYQDFCDHFSVSSKVVSDISLNMLN